MKRSNSSNNNGLIKEQPDLLVRDPIDGDMLRCDDLRERTHECFRRAYAEITPTQGTDRYDRERARALVAPCYVRTRFVVGTCGLGVRIGPYR